MYRYNYSSYYTNNRYKVTRNCCAHKHRICCCEHQQDPVNTCTTIVNGDVRSLYLVRAYNGTQLLGETISFEGGVNITQFVPAATQLEIYISKTIATNEFLYGDIQSFPQTNGVPGVLGSIGFTNSQDGFIPSSLPGLNGGTKSTTSYLYILVKPVQGWPNLMELPFIYTASEFTKPECTFDGTDKVTFTHSFQQSTNSQLSLKGVPTGTVTDPNKPYNQTFNVSMKAVAPSGTDIQYTVANNDPSLDTRLVFVQPGPDLKFNQSLQDNVGGPISYTNVYEDSTFTIAEQSRYPDNTIHGEKTFNVTVQAPDAPRIFGIYPTYIPVANNVKSLGSGDSYLFYQAGVDNKWVVQQNGGNPAVKPTIWFEFWKVGTTQAPRIQIAPEFFLQPTYNTLSSIQGRWINTSFETIVSPNYSTTTNSIIANSTPWNAAIASKLVSGYNLIGFEFTNIPPKAQQEFVYIVNIATNNYDVVGGIWTMQELFTSNSLGTPVSDLFYTTAQPGNYAGQWKGLTNGQGVSYFTITKGNVRLLTMGLEFQGGITMIASDGTEQDVFGCNVGQKDFCVARLWEYPRFFEDATTVVYAFKKIVGGQGTIRGIRYRIKVR